MPFTPVESSIGAVLLGYSITAHLYFNGRVSGMSGCVASVCRVHKTKFEEWTLKLSYLLGLFAGGFLLTSIPQLSSQAFNTSSIVLEGSQWIVFVLGGILIGFGTQLGSGCTSGHM
jgi:uncharacterized protein